MRVCRQFHFDAAHRLPNYEGQCANLHGHRWVLEVEVKGKVDSGTGFVLDFSVLRTIVEKEVLQELDHRYLNDTCYNPTCENILVWVGQRLSGKLKQDNYHLSRLRLYETPDSYAEEIFGESFSEVNGGH